MHREPETMVYANVLGTFHVLRKNNVTCVNTILWHWHVDHAVLIKFCQLRSLTAFRSDRAFQSIRDRAYR